MTTAEVTHEPHVEPFAGGRWDVPAVFAECYFLGAIIGPSIGQVTLDAKTGIVDNAAKPDLSRPQILNSAENREEGILAATQHADENE